MPNINSNSNLSQNPLPAKKSKLHKFIITIVVIAVLLTALFVVGVLITLSSSKSSDTAISYRSSDVGEGLGANEILPASPTADTGFGSSTKTDSAVATETNGTEIDLTEQKIIKTGSLEMEVESVSDTITKITNLAEKEQGFVQSSDVSTLESGAMSAYVIMRMPADKFTSVLNSLKGYATSIANENVSGQDVTEEFVDLQAQLKNYQAEETAYAAMLEKAVSVEDMLKVQEQLSIVRGNIESTQGRIKYLTDKTDLATITAYITEEVSIEIPADKWQPLKTVKESWHNLIVVCQKIINGLIRFGIVVLPIMVIIGLAFWLVVRLLKKWLKKDQ